MKKKLLFIFTVLLFCVSKGQQRVGIRTTSPQAALDVRGISNPAVIASGSYTQLMLMDSTPGNYNAIELRKQGITDAWKWSAYTNAGNSSLAGMQFRVGSNNPAFQILGNGNLGVNVLTPVYPLHIKNNTAATGLFSGPDSMRIIVSEAGSHKGYIGGTQLNNNTRDIELGTVSGNNSSLHLTIQQTPALTILNNGNIGIGTTMPAGNIAVNGGVVLDQNDTNDGTFNSNRLVVLGSTNMYSYPPANSGEGIGSKRTAGQGQYGLDFYIDETQVMHISNGGNIGVGVPAPVRKLENPGTLYAQRLKTAHGFFPVTVRKKAFLWLDQYNNWNRTSAIVTLNNSFTDTDFRVLVTPFIDGFDYGNRQLTTFVKILNNNQVKITLIDNNPYVPGNINTTIDVGLYIMAIKN